MTSPVRVAVVGAGPYGLSLAAHLDRRRVPYRIFGRPMESWRTHMPKGMHLKSEGFASNICEPTGAFTLAQYSQEQQIPYADIGAPVARETFVNYGLAFQQRYVPNLEQEEVISIDRASDGYRLRLSNDSFLNADKVVIATGISQFHYLPPALEPSAIAKVEHSSAHSDYASFAGKHVTIVGGGASAIDVAVDLIGAGASPRIVVRGDQLRFHDAPGERSLADKIKRPQSGLGPGWRSRLCTDAPLLFHLMPESFRIRVVKNHLGPSGCWFTRSAVEGKVEVLLRTRVDAVKQASNDRLRLSLSNSDGATEVETDHVIGATGYRVDLSRLKFLDTLRSEIRLVSTSPVLSMNFESSVPGFYFVGLAAANSFGPISRFAFGARFTARRLAAHLYSKG